MNKILKYIFLAIILISTCLGFTYWYSKNRSIQAFDLSKIEGKKNLVPIAVIGSGPAGLSSALYGARAAVYTVVFQGDKPGGQLTETTYVENWPGTKKLLGTDLIDQNRKQAEKFGAIMANDSIEHVDFSTWPFRLQTTEGHEINALSIIIATGAKPKLLNVTGEKEYWAYGVTTCAVCDAPLYKNKDVVVVGGGDSAIEEATLLASYAKNVTLLVREKLRAAPAMQERLKGFNNIKVMLGVSINKILGDKNNVTEIEIINNKDKSISKMPIDGVFIAIGHIPNTEIFKDFIALDKAGYIDLKNYQETSQRGVFAAGDVTDNRYRQAGTSAGDGIKAGLDAISFLQEIGYNEIFFKKIQDNLYDPDQDTQVELKKLVTNKDLDDLLKTNKPLVVEVGAEYCTSCKVLLNSVKSVAAKLEDKVNFAQIDLDDEPKELKERFNIKSIPALLVFKDSKLVGRHEKQILSKYELYNLVNNLNTEE
ncbi:FAD-dependent oxidoreductase [Candidatus Babela massiliensis]|uniref:Thioredoxin-disulfide reductase n=1 Tax=Candidatus Babela massiliensis TaxID=673862 RepID=V6DEV9_9BACT|nr:FAD-dependent oxidoreductase [Candidatus Babela massiliensis]CDK30115.1 thioredoxin-disulfide reductase [Candidatus Babela massiliensis]